MYMFGSETGERTNSGVVDDSPTFSSVRELGILLDVKAQGDVPQRLRQLLPQQDFIQLWGIPVLVEGGEDRFWLSLGGVRGLVRVHQGDWSSGLRRVNGVVGGRLSGGLHVSRSTGGVLVGCWDGVRVLGRHCGRRTTV